MSTRQVPRSGPLFATTPAARELVVDQIEGVAQARSIAAGTAYLPFVSSTDVRDRFCRDHG